MLGRILNAKFIPSNVDVGLLLLRIGTGLVLFLKHGMDKVPRLFITYPTFPDPLHIGHTFSWELATLSDGFCSLLIVLGLGTRWVSLYCFFNIFIAWSLVHRFPFWGRDPMSDHGELMTLYLSALITLIVTGPGRYSVDALVDDAPQTYNEAA